MPYRSETWQQIRAACNRASLERSPELPDHRPVVAVLACSDARLSPARLFDLPEGSLFVVRVAGNIATPEAVASLTYAVERLGVDTVVVLGHSHCGAVTAAVSDETDPALACLVDPIRASLAAAPACDDLECAVERNVAATVAALWSDPGPLGTALRSGRTALHGAVLDLATTTLTDLPTPSIPSRSTTA
jgi:carbonic anhydrase